MLSACRPDAPPSPAPAKTPVPAERDAPQTYRLPSVKAERADAPAADGPGAWTVRSDGDGMPEAEAQDLPDRRARAYDVLPGYADAYFAALSGYDVDAMLALYADRVRFYDLGVVSRDAIREDKQRYVRRWPERIYTPDGAPDIAYDAVTRQATVRLTYAFAVGAPGRKRAGRAWTELVYESPDDGRSWQIVAERGGTR